MLAEVCARLGVAHDGAELLRFTANAVFRLRSTPLVVRINGSYALRHRAEKVIKVAHWLAACELPSVRPLADVEQPVRVGEYVATVWHAITPAGDPPRPEGLARLLRRLHGLPLPDFALPAWAPLDDVRRRLTDAEDLAPDDREFLHRRGEDLARQLGELPFSHDERVVHGDAWLGNLIPTESGPVLCDFDATCVGPPVWDLVPFAFGVRRLGYPAADYRRFADEYGYDITSWPGFEVLAAIRELKLITSVLPIARSNPSIRAELRRRLRSVREGDADAQWVPYR
ncbi:MAG: aminoglycoside phosphotransferase family protein [Sciscionella sp.]|nr:aminoglycoside phosphotransferase family protein [Sciscionella sp.]